MKKIYFLLFSLVFMQSVLSQTTYTFTGNGLWSVATNWSNNTIPPNSLPSGSAIYISTSPGNSCYLNVIQTILPGATFVISPGATLIIAGGLLNNVSLPTVTTNPPFSASAHTTQCGGNVIANGGSPVTERGICYGPSSNPTTANSIVASGVGNGSFAISLTGLADSATYHIRAFAKNAAGTAYGTDTSFTTLNDPTLNAITAKLKKISYPLDTVTPLCQGCLPIVSQVTDSFSYDTQNRVVQMKRQKKNLTFPFSNGNTTSVYSYVYDANNQNISFYTELNDTGSLIQHRLSYNAQNQLFLDTVYMGPSFYNYVAYFTYLPNAIIKTTRQYNATSGIIDKVDTFSLTNNQLTNERYTKTFNQSGLIEFVAQIYSPSIFRNPMYYLQSIALLEPENSVGLSFKLPAQKIYQGQFTGLPLSILQTQYQMTLDAFGRVITLSNSDVNYSRVISFEYY